MIRFVLCTIIGMWAIQGSYGQDPFGKIERDKIFVGALKEKKWRIDVAPERIEIPRSAEKYDLDIDSLIALNEIRISLHFSNSKEFDDYFRPSRQSDPSLIFIKIGIASLSTSRKCNYTVWSKSKMVDDLDNKYDQLFASSKEEIRIDGLRNYKTDFIAFEKPVANAKILSIDLPCENFGEKGTIKIKIKR
jgi:hypothetical protein